LPKLFKFGNYYIFFWSNENDEPIHVHISLGRPTANATKVWITKGGGYVVEHNKSDIPQKDLNQILDAIKVHFFFICSEWKRVFDVDTITFYC